MSGRWVIAFSLSIIGVATLFFCLAHWYTDTQNDVIAEIPLVRYNRGGVTMTQDVSENKSIESVVKPDFYETEMQLAELSSMIPSVNTPLSDEMSSTEAGENTFDDSVTFDSSVFVPIVKAADFSSSLTENQPVVTAVPQPVFTPNQPNPTSNQNLNELTNQLPHVVENNKDDMLKPIVLTPVYRAEPRYPINAVRRGIEGFVIVHFTLTHNGRTKNVRVLDASPKRIFNRAAIDAVKKWRYSESGSIDMPIREQTVRLTFSLNNSG